MSPTGRTVALAVDPDRARPPKSRRRFPVYIQLWDTHTGEWKPGRRDVPWDLFHMDFGPKEECFLYGIRCKDIPIEVATGRQRPDLPLPTRWEANQKCRHDDIVLSYGMNWPPNTGTTKFNPGRSPQLCFAESGARIVYLGQFAKDCVAADFNSSGTELAVGSESGELTFWHRRRPEQWYGIAYLPESWLTLLFTIALVWSLRRDWMQFGAVKKNVDEEVEENSVT